MRALVAALLLFGCGEPHTGEVQSFSYTPGYYYTTFIWIGKTMYPQVHFAPAVCYVRMKDGWTCSSTGECCGIEQGEKVTMSCEAP